ncbi:MAG: hypothetical protein CUN55_02740 [Phototrophicales bacterium]|nr:MAG: hypothetical protein CUN55_02740 [Phototrophicales bacterium]
MGAVFWKQFYSGRRSILWWSLGLLVYTVLTVSFYPSLLEERETYQELVDSYPDAMLEFFEGIEDITDPANYVNVQLFSYMPLIFGIFAILQGLNSITGEERNQTMDTLATLPIPRWQILTEKFLGTGVILLGILTGFYISLVLSVVLFPELDLGLDALALAAYGLFFPVMIIAGVAYLCSAALPLHRRWGGAIASTYMVGSYLIYNLGNINDSIKPLQALTVFDYYNAIDALHKNWALSDLLIMILAIAALYGASVFLFERRDIGR